MRETEFCKHYRAMSDHDTCSKGVAYETFKGMKFEKRPCFMKCGRDPNPGCSLMEMPTKEEIKAREKEIAQQFAKIVIAREAIKAACGGEWKRGDDGKRGRIDCPVCGGVGSLGFTRASYNGHIHAACETEGCVRWLE